MADTTFLRGQSTSGGSRWEGRLVERIEFAPEAQPLPRTELLSLLTLAQGKPLDREDVRESIQSLFATGRFSDISIDADEGTSGTGVTIRVTTEPTFFMSGVTVDGVSSPPNRNQLTNAAKLELGTAFKDGAMEQAAANMQERLRANGLFQAKIQSHLETLPATEEVIGHFDLETGERAHFAGVEIKGNSTHSPEQVIRATRWRRGIFPIPWPGWREVTENRIQDGLQRVRSDFQKDNRLQARVTLDRLDYDEKTNTVTPTLLIDSGPVIEVTAKGVKISRTRLRQLLPVYEEQAVDRGLLLEGTRNLYDYMQAQGYFEAAVDFTQSSTDGGVQTIEYVVDRKGRHKLVKVEITGNTFFDENTLRERLSLREAGSLRYRRGRYSQKLRDNDRDAIRELYRSNGYRDVEVLAETVDDFAGRTDELAVRFTIREGALWTLNRLELDGIPDTEVDYVRSIIQSSPGQAFSEVNVAADRDAILGYLFNKGFSGAEFEWTQTPAPRPNQVDLHYSVRSGERQFVRGVLVRGLQATDADLVQSKISLHDGDPLSQGELAATQQRLYDLGIFSRVQTALQNPTGTEVNKYVILRFDEANKYAFNAGFGAELARIGGGIDTLDDPAGRALFAPRVSAGVSRLNAFGVGHTVSLQGRVSTLQQRAVLSYLAPQFKGNERLALTLSGLFDTTKNVRTFSARRWEGSIQLSDRLSRASTLFYRFSFRRVSLDQNNLKFTNLIPLLSQPVRVGLFAISYVQDRRDNANDSHRGIYNTIDAGISLPQFGSETSFTRLVLRNSTYHPLNRDVTLARTVQFGYTQRLAGLAEIPFAERFFGGGAFSHRAFPDNQAGPRDPVTGFPLGGTALLFHSTELRFPLIGDNLGGVLFHDIGNVYSDIRHIRFGYHQNGSQNFDYMVHSVGFGIRYKTPVGPIRIDLSYGPNSPYFDGFQGTLTELQNAQGTLPTVRQRINQFQFHFSLGQTF